MEMPDTAYQEFLAVVSAADLTSERLFGALEALVRVLVGAKLFTVTTEDDERLVARRLYSTNPEVYPVHGEKPYELNEWTDVVNVGKRSFVANDIETIARVFHDADVMKSIGCEAIINVPVIIGGKVVATLNCSHEAGYYTEDRVAASEQLKLPGTICILLHEKLEKELAA